MIRTIRCKLKQEPTTETALTETSQIFAQACNEVLKASLENSVSDALTLHRLLYYSLRGKYPLSANLTIRAIRRVSQALSALKRKRKKPKLFRSASIDYDARICTFFESSESVSLSTVRGRIRVSLDIGEYQRTALKGKQVTCATVVKRGKAWYINICIEEPDCPPLGPPNEGKPMGIDLGIRNTAVTTTGFQAPGIIRQEFKEKRATIRASLQSKGTRGARNVLRRISGYLGERNQDVFKCIACGESHADENAAWNIAKGGAEVNRPELTMDASIH